MDEPDLISSEYTQKIEQDGYRFQINIISSTIDPEWCLEIVGENGTSVCWEETFQHDDEAYEAAMLAITEEGSTMFDEPPKPSNVIPFSTQKDT
jgi:hypothetical protein